jgi:hypothetical protein
MERQYLQCTPQCDTSNRSSCGGSSYNVKVSAEASARVEIKSSQASVSSISISLSYTTGTLHYTTYAQQQ